MACQNCCQFARHFIFIIKICTLIYLAYWVLDDFGWINRFRVRPFLHSRGQALDRVDDGIQLGFNPVKQVQCHDDRKTHIADERNQLLHLRFLLSGVVITRAGLMKQTGSSFIRSVHSRLRCVRRYVHCQRRQGCHSLARTRWKR